MSWGGRWLFVHLCGCTSLEFLFPLRCSSVATPARAAVHSIWTGAACPSSSSWQEPARAARTRSPAGGGAGGLRTRKRPPPLELWRPPPRPPPAPPLPVPVPALPRPRRTATPPLCQLATPPPHHSTTMTFLRLPLFACPPSTTRPAKLPCRATLLEAPLLHTGTVWPHSCSGSDGWPSAAGADVRQTVGAAFIPAPGSTTSWVEPLSALSTLDL